MEMEKSEGKCPFKKKKKVRGGGGGCVVPPDPLW
jgi:hypothetical protein